MSPDGLFRAIAAKDVPGVMGHDRRPFFEFALRFMAPRDRVLDVGAGDGAFAALRDCRDTTFLFEGNEESAERLKRRFPHVVHGQLPDLPYADNQFDACHCSHVLEHLDPERVYETLREIDRCLRPGGVLVLSFPVLWSGFYADLSHVRPYDEGAFLKYLSATRPPPFMTRSVIAGRYELLDRLDRCRKTPPVTVAVGAGGVAGALARKALNALARVLRGAGVERIEVTGKTLVLRKLNGTAMSEHDPAR